MALPSPPPPPGQPPPPPMASTTLLRSPGRGRSTSRPLTVSQRLLSLRGLKSNGTLWIEDEEDVWVKAIVEGQANTMLTCRKCKDGSLVTIDLGFTTTSQADAAYGVADMTSLSNIHEAALLENLQKRFIEDKPYTYMSNVLVAVNPLKPLPAPKKKEFYGLPFNPDLPHPYGIAEVAFQHLQLPDPTTGSTSTNQAVIISGESGAGKSETAKMVLKYLVHRSSNSISSLSGGLDERFVQSSPILEAFGNACTVRNHNSSRFGKFLLASFSPSLDTSMGSWSLDGGQIQTYLLEKSRVVRLTGQGERNFHVFYQLLAGLSDGQERTQLGLEGKTAKDFSYLTNKSFDSGSAPPPQPAVVVVDEAKKFLELEVALQSFGVHSEGMQWGLWRALAAILHLGNVKVVARDAVEGTVASLEGGEEALNQVAGLLGVDLAQLTDVLSKRKVKTKGEVFLVPLSPQDAAYARDAVAKDMYSRIFQWLLRRVNFGLRRATAIGGKATPDAPAPREPPRVVGILDIFGFESFARNGLEQLLINHANESLQNLFNQTLFNTELELYRSEGINVNVSSRPDNSECLTLLLTKPQGILPSLDVISASLDPSDDKYVATLHKNLARHPSFPKTHPKEKGEAFWVKHFAGEVKYSTGDWVAKNNDAIPEGLSDLLASCKAHPLLKDAFAQPSTTGTGKKETVTSRFIGSLDRLTEALKSTKCSFVRCIKPNSLMRPGDYNRKYVVGQLRCLGLVQSCEVLKVGLPTRLKYSDVKARLAGLPPDVTQLFEGESDEVFVSAVMWAFGVPEGAYHLGRTRVFFGNGQVEHLQNILQFDMASRGAWVSTRLKEAMQARREAAQALDEAENSAAELIAREAMAKASYAQILEHEDKAHAAIRAADIQLETINAELDDCGAAVEAAHSLAASMSFRESNESLALLSSAKERLGRAKDALAKARKAPKQTEEHIEELKHGDWSQVAVNAWGKLRALETLSEEMARALEAARIAANRCDGKAAQLAVRLGQELLNGRGRSTHSEVVDLLGQITQTLQNSIPALEQRVVAQVDESDAAIDAITDELLRFQEELGLAQEKEVAARALRLKKEEATVKAQREEEERQRRQQQAEEEAAAAAVAAMALKAQATAISERQAFRSINSPRAASFKSLGQPTSGTSLGQPATPHSLTSSTTVHTARSAHSGQSPLQPQPQQQLEAEHSDSDDDDDDDDDELTGRGAVESVKSIRVLSTRSGGPDLAALVQQLQQGGPSSPGKLPQQQPGGGEEGEEEKKEKKRGEEGEEARSPLSDGSPVAVLPPGWMETVSKTYGIPYFTNKFTGESVWERPTEAARSQSGRRVYPAISVGDGAAPLPEGYSEAADEGEEGDLPPLPAGWQEYVSDMHGGIPYYFNQVTKETVWERPNKPALVDDEEEEDEDKDTEEEVKGKDNSHSSSKKDKHVEDEDEEEETRSHSSQEPVVPAHAQHEQVSSSSGSSHHSRNVIQGDSPPSKRSSASPMPRSTKALAAIPAAATTTTTREPISEEVEQQPPPPHHVEEAVAEKGRQQAPPPPPKAPERKEGYVLKKSRAFLLRRKWKRRYLVIENGLLKAYHDKARANTSSSSNCKTMHLDSESVVALAGLEKGLMVRTREMDWLLVMQTDEDLDEWHETIYAHILELRRDVLKRKQDLLDMANQAQGSLRLLYQVDKDDTLPDIGIRISPEIDAPKRALARPGEVMEVASIVADPNVGVLFLKLSGDREGWLLDRHPVSKQILVRRLHGRFEKVDSGKKQLYVASTDLPAPVPISRLPLDGGRSAKRKGAAGDKEPQRFVQAGEAVKVVEKFIYTPSAKEPQQGEEQKGQQESRGDNQEWLRLGGSAGGWVPTVDTITGKVLFEILRG